MQVDQTENFVVRTRRSPTVKIDTAVSAAYVRFKHAPVARTVRQASKWPSQLKTNRGLAITSATI